MKCPSCAFENPDGFKFCGSCGGALGAAAVAPAPPKPVAVSDAGRTRPIADERRTVTILFADMKGFTALSETLDPEDVQEVMTGVFTRLASVVKGFGGTIDKYIGDAIMALFGAPIALGDDAERAVRAGIGMQRALAEYRAETKRALGLRVGINTGKVIWGQTNDGSFTVMGDPVNLASRLEKACPVDGVLIGEATHRHVKNRFSLESQEPIHVKGKAEAQRTFLVHGEVAIVGRATGAGGPRTPFVGRDEEMEALTELFAGVSMSGAAAGGVITIEATPGTGKSRLVREAREEAEERDLATLAARAPAFGHGAPYAPWADLLGRAASLGNLDHAAARTQLAEWEERFAPGSGADARWLHELAGVADTGDAEIVRRRAAPSRFRAGLAEALAAFLTAAARRKPVLLVAEDLHWWSLPSLDLLVAAVEICRVSRLAILATRRPEEAGTPPLSVEWPPMQPEAAAGRGWGSGGEAPANSADRVFRLGPLDTSALRSLVHGMLGQEVPEGLVRRLELLSGGNPLFAEEIVQAFEDKGALRLEPSTLAPGTRTWVWDEAKAERIELPTSVEGVTQARIDALPARERRVLQAAAVAGRVFWEGLVDAMRGEPCIGALRNLVTKDLAHPRRSRLPGENEYGFKHATIQAVAYEVSLKRERVADHRRVAEWLEAKAEASDPALATTIGEHWLRGEEKGRALPWLLIAAEEAVRVFAKLDEAQLVEDAVSTAEAVGEEASLGKALRLRGRLRRIAGHAGAEVDLRRATAIAERLDDPLGRAEAGVDLAGSLQQRGAFADAEACATGTLAAARRVSSARHETLALNMLGVVAQMGGRHDAARERYAEALAAATRGGDPALVGFMLNTIGHYHLANEEYVDAIEAFHRALGMDISKENAAFLRSNLGAAYLAVGDLDAADAILREAIDASERMGLRFILAEAGIRRGGVTAARGDIAAGLAAIDRGCTLAREIGATEPLTEGLLRRGVLLSGGDAAAARIALDEAKALAEKDGLGDLLAKIAAALSRL